jgi:hypothetical protein
MSDVTDREILLSPGDIVLLTRRVNSWDSWPPGRSNSKVIHLEQSPFLVIERESRATSTKIENRWVGLIDEMIRVFLWPAKEGELLNNYTIKVFHPQTGTTDQYRGLLVRDNALNFSHGWETTTTGTYNTSKGLIGIAQIKPRNIGTV